MKKYLFGNFCLKTANMTIFLAKSCQIGKIEVGPTQIYIFTLHCVQKSIIYESRRSQKPSMPWKPLHKKIQPPPTVSLYQFGLLRYEQKGKQSQFLGNIDYWVIAEMV